ncbi:MAG: hypothetical protein RIC85_04930 [Gammaproteobacteria bacterium]
MDMTDQEAIEALSDLAIAGATYFSMFISITFAYLTVAYLVGSKLTRFQAAVISSFYVIGSLLTGSATAVWNEGWFNLYRQVPSVMRDVWLVKALAWTELLYIVLIGIVAASLYFMHDIRARTPNKAVESDT